MKCASVYSVYGLLSMSNNYFIYNAYNTFSNVCWEYKKNSRKGKLLVESLFEQKKVKEIRYLGT